MSSDPKRRLRCAVYTRKSSEEGLEQSFNSLDAQREACAAFIVSQRHEGWVASPAKYDDGGYSGGSMDRPALQALLADIHASKIDVVVVYKVDRLTRSLADFAKIVELFDAHKVSFVSVTQQFNTTSSMGRLTLNVLLSFAQFEREVTGERIRDKIAASKKKGMWMGGHVPLGYDLVKRQLVPNGAEAGTIERIFRGYLALGCVRKLQIELRTSGVRSKMRLGRGGKKSGGVPYSRGALYSILRNRIYIGEIAHRSAVYAGQHPPIIDRNLWDAVQAKLTANRQSHALGLRANSPSLLAGLLFDAEGRRYTPIHATKKGKRYRYYVAQASIRKDAGAGGRIPAHDVETLVVSLMRRILSDPEELLLAASGRKDGVASKKGILQAAALASSKCSEGTQQEKRAFLVSMVARITLSEQTLALTLSRARLRQLLGAAATPEAPGGDYVATVETHLRRLGGEIRIISPSQGSGASATRVNEALIKALARGRQWLDTLMSGQAPSLQA
ncbi:MAG: site-specific recombinase, partial [Betaproteobacteria bacterium]|nr:site-specific recombinase [Betaproteobacteria bacterium]